MLRIAMLALASATLAGAATQPPRNAVREADKIHAREFEGLYACAIDRILAGPDGEVAVWEGDDRTLLGMGIFSPGEIIIGRMREPARSREDRLLLYLGAGRPFVPLRWAGRDGLLYVRVRDPETRILQLAADGRPVTEVARLGPDWRGIALNGVGHGGIEPLLHPSAGERVQRIDGKTFIRGHATLGATLELVGARRSDMELVRIGEASLDPVRVNANHTRYLTLFPDSSRYEAGIAYAGAPLSGPLGYHPYQRPLVDQATGRVAGKFGSGGILIEDRKGRLSRNLARFRRLHGETHMVLDASLSGEILMVLTLSGRGNRTIVRIGPEGISERPVCTDFFVPNPRTRRSPNPLVSSDTGFRPLFRAFALDSRGREVMEAGRPIVTLHRLGKGPAQDALLNLRGGPGGSNLTGDHQLHHLERFLAPGRDIVSLEYSGSVGGGGALTRRLGERGMAALGDDLDAVVRWLDRRGYRRVFIVATSFGGVPALVALDRHRRRFDAAYFFAPMLRLPEPEEHVKRGPFDSPDADTQLAFEQALLGGKSGRERFKTELAALVARAPLRASDHFHFAAKDPTSMAAHLPPGTAATHEIVPRTIHMSILATPEAWAAIEQKIR